MGGSLGAMSTAPLSEFYNLMAVGNVVAWASVDGGPPFRLRPGSEKDRATPGTAMLWRYMPKDRFFDLLDRRALFFTRLTRYHDSDPFEGALQYGVAKIHEQIVREKGGDVQEFLRERERFVKKFLKVVLVNCWHEREYESRPMWDRYGRGGEAVAVVTTFDALKQSVPEHVDVGHMDYIDAGSDEIRNHSANPSHRAFQKRREFEDEREVRCVIFDYPEHGPKPDEEIPIAAGTDTGYHVPVDLSRLVAGAVVSPDSPQIIGEVRQKLVESGIEVEIVPSTLLTPPTY